MCRMAYSSPQPGCSKGLVITIESSPASVPVSPVKPVFGRDSAVKCRRLLFELDRSVVINIWKIMLSMK